jgi:hypothetical protein
MKAKMHYRVQPRAIVPPRKEQVQQEIRNFLLAVDSYPKRVAKEPEITFQEHLCSFFASASGDCRDNRPRRH